MKVDWVEFCRGCGASLDSYNSDRVRCGGCESRLATLRPLAGVATVPGRVTMTLTTLRTD